MEVTTQRLDHFGIVAGVIKDIRLVELIDARISNQGHGGFIPTQGNAGV
jgi:hypothetical protein